MCWSALRIRTRPITPPVATGSNANEGVRMLGTPLGRSCMSSCAWPLTRGSCDTRGLLRQPGTSLRRCSPRQVSVSSSPPNDTQMSPRSLSWKFRTSQATCSMTRIPRSSCASMESDGSAAGILTSTGFLFSKSLTRFNPEVPVAFRTPWCGFGLRKIGPNIAPACFRTLCKVLVCASAACPTSDGYSKPLIVSPRFRPVLSKLGKDRVPKRL